jgi:hypothetical protein
MTGVLAINIILALIVLAVILGMAAWAVITHPRDRTALVGERRRVADRRTVAAPTHIERRNGERRYGSAVTA